MVDHTCAVTVVSNLNDFSDNSIISHQAINCTMNVLLISSALYIVVAANSADSKPLNVDVEWIFQGNEFGFQGFFVEYLGISSAMRSLLPLSRITPSNFKRSFEESGFSNKEKFFDEDLFTEESNHLKWLIDKAVIDKDDIPGILNPVSLYSPPLTPDSCVSRAHFEEDYVYFGNNLAKFRSSSASSDVDCCVACTQNPLCTAWTYDPSQFGCELKGGASQFAGMSVAGATSGRMKNVAAQRGRAPVPKVIVFHGTTCIHNNRSIVGYRRDVNTIYIGRFMVEREKFLRGQTVDENSIAQCAAFMDEIWVPTEWHKKVFEDWLRLMGIRSPVVEVVPEAVDTRLFDPVTAVPVRRSQVNAIETEVSIVGSGDSEQGTRKQCSFVGEAVKCLNNERFEFLSNFKWEHRKGWDLLLDAYWTAFTAEDDVLLRIRSYMPSFLRGEKNITKTIEQYAQRTLGKPLSELAAVVWESGALPERLSDSLTRADVRDLLASVDSFVLPTRGEGWGLPIVEAMSMELPVIVTNHSGPTAYATEENTYLLPVLPELDSFGFGQPDVAALKRY